MGQMEKQSKSLNRLIGSECNINFEFNRDSIPSFLKNAYISIQQRIKRNEYLINLIENVSVHGYADITSEFCSCFNGIPHNSNFLYIAPFSTKSGSRILIAQCTDSVQLVHITRPDEMDSYICLQNIINRFRISGDRVFVTNSCIKLEDISTEYLISYILKQNYIKAGKAIVQLITCINGKTGSFRNVFIQKAGKLKKHSFNTIFSSGRAPPVSMNVVNSLMSHFASIILIVTLSLFIACGGDSSDDGPTTPIVPDTTNPTVDSVDVDLNNILTVSASDNETLDKILLRVDTNKDGLYTDETEVEYDGSVSVDKIARQLGVGYNESFNLEVRAKDAAGNISDAVYSSFTTKANAAPTVKQMYERSGGEWVVSDGEINCLTGNVARYRVELSDDNFDALELLRNVSTEWSSTQITDNPLVPNEGDVYIKQDPDGTGNNNLYEIRMSTVNIAPRGPPYTMQDKARETSSPDNYESPWSEMKIYVDSL